MKVSCTTRASDFTQKLARLVQERKDLTMTKYPLVYRSGTFEFVRIASKDIDPTDSVLLIRAGIHGDEISGPLTIEQHGNEIFDYANAHGVKVLLYPLGNPSGFSSGIRYNIDNDKGDGGNNDFLRYELEDGTFKDDIGAGEIPFRRFLWASDPSLGIHLPLETELMHRLLKEDPLSQIKGSVDLHQDYITLGAPPATYQYPVGNVEAYQPIIEKVSETCPIFRNQFIGAGFQTKIDDQGNVVGNPLESEAMMSDENGSIVRHDGTLGDLLYRLGIPYNVTPETTGVTPLNVACMVNLLWIKGIINLISQ